MGSYPASCVNSCALLLLLQMILQAKHMQLELLEVRASTAVLMNRLVRLDNPILRMRLAQAADAVRAAEAIALPTPV